MLHYVVAVPINQRLAEFIGKKGSENGITFYNRKSDNDIIVAVGPSDIEMKFYGMAEALAVSRQVVISTESVDRSLGEALVAASLMGRHTIITDDNDIKSILAGSELKNFEISSKEELLGRIIRNKAEKNSNGVAIDIDHAFNVKGVGTVALGIVRSGTVKVHDTLYHASGKQVSIRSIQSQDVNIESAEPETRVGLALKGMEADEMEKGDVLSSKPVPRIRKFAAAIKMSGFAAERLGTPKRYGFVSNFAYAEAMIELEEGTTTVVLEKPFPLSEGESFLLLRSNMPRIFASGIIESIIE